MTKRLELDPDLEHHLQQVRARLQRQRLNRNLTRVGLWTFGLTVACTPLLMMLTDYPLLSNLTIVLWVALNIYGFFRWVRPLYKNPVTLEQTALLLDEHHPELQNRLINLVSPASADKPDNTLDKKFLLESQAFVRTTSIPDESRKPLPEMGCGVIAGMLLLSLVTMAIWHEGWLPQLNFSWGAKQTLFTVEPGDAKVRLGDDQVIVVKSEMVNKAVSLSYRVEGADWVDKPMKLGDSDQVHFYRFDNIRQELDYRIHFGAKTSQIYHLSLWLPPETEAIDITYHYPDYLNQPAREVPNSGDITALEGTRVVLEAAVNKPLTRVEMVLEKTGERIAFTALDELTWHGEYTLAKNDSYFLDLEDENGDHALFNPDYEITVLPDKPPSVKMSFPYWDMDVSSLDEVEFEMSVTDDFGVAEYGIFYQVSGREPVTVKLEKKPGLKNHGSHMLYLEDLNLQPGDVITWSPFAADHKPDRDQFAQMGDPYLMQVRPFKRMFQEATSNAGQQGGGEDPATKQREVMIATWKLRRELSQLNAESYGERHQIIIDAQRQVAEMLSQNPSQDPIYEQLMKVLDQAITALDDAQWPEPTVPLGQATEKQTEAYRLIRQMMPEVSQVAQQRGDQAGGGGAQASGMDELEMKRNRNFYEDERRTKMEQQAAAETLDKVKDLAQRQKMLNQEIARLISEMERDGADEEEIKRRLERLKEEARKNIEELDDVKRDVATNNMDQQKAQEAQQKLDQVREEMNRGLESLRPDNLQQARAAGSQALEELDKLEQDLEKQARGSAEERMQQLREQMAGLNQKQQEIRDKIEQLGQEKDSPKLTADDPKQTAKNELLKEKEKLQQDFLKTMEEASEVADMTRGSQEMLSRKLGDWLRETSREGIGEEMEEASTLARYGVWDELAKKEEDIARKLQQVEKRLGEVAENQAGDEIEAREKALEKVESMLQQAQKQPGQSGEQRMESFADKEYREWLDKLRDVEGLLGDDAMSRPLNKVRRDIEKMRRRFKRDQLIPKYDMFLNNVVEPLSLTATQLRQDIQARRKQRNFVLQDDGSVPDQYRKNVSEYFRALSDSEGN